MKILVLTNNDIGLYKFRKELLERLVLDGHEVLISLPAGELIPDLERLGCRHVPTEFNRRGMNPRDDLKLLKHYKAILQRERPAVVLTYTIKPNVYGGIACGKLGIPYISNVTGLGTAIENPGILQRLVLALYKKGLSEAACIFFQNKENKEIFLRRGIVRAKTGLLPGSGVNLREHTLEEFPSQSNGLRFLFVGRIMQDKGIQEFFEAARIVKNRDPTCTFSIIGECDEDYSKQLTLLAEEGIIEWLGFQREVHSHIRDSHCTILPSYHEGTSNVLLESAASGRPVIATDVPGCRETFKEGITGFGCKARDVESLVDAIFRFIELPWDIKRNMGMAGRRKMEREFDRDFVVAAYLREIEKALGGL